MIDELTGTDFQADPLPFYERWRTEGPVRRFTWPGSGYDTWLVTRYEDCRRALTDPRLSKMAGPISTPTASIEAAMFSHMLSADPPDHTRLRRLVSSAFTARRMEALRPRIEQITAELLDAMDGQDQFDLLDAYAFPLPIQVICELLGVPPQDRDNFRTWTHALVTGADERGAMGALAHYITELISTRRTTPGDDLLSGLIGVRDEGGDRLTENELSSMVFLLLIAGHETTVNLIGNGTWLLLSDPARWDRLRGDLSLLPTAIEEFLRYTGPVAVTTYRRAAEELEIGGVTIPAGDEVVIGLQSADQDPARFDNPAELRLDRTDNPHLAFGHGIHYCLGAPLARMEAQIAFTGLLTRFPDLRLAAPASSLGWKPGWLLRGLQRLPVKA